MLAEFGTGQVFWSMVWFFMFTLWIWMVITIYMDIFRSPDLSGWGKAAWSLFVLFTPFLGVFTYLIVRGKKMNEHAIDEARAREEAFRGYVRDVATPNPTDQLSQLANLRDQGVINDDEFARMKGKLTWA